MSRLTDFSDHWTFPLAAGIIIVGASWAVGRWALNEAHRALAKRIGIT